LIVVTFDLTPRTVPVVAWVAVTRHVPDAFVGSDNTEPLIEQPVAVPSATPYVTALPLPPVVANVSEVLKGATVVVMTRDAGVENVVLSMT
jgi:hypothetical protein